MGKRRMTQQSENYLTPTPNPSFIWGLFHETDRTQWKWQAPTNRTVGKESPKSILPAWLSDFVYKKEEDIADIVYERGDPIWQKWKAEENVSLLRSSVQCALIPGDLDMTFSENLLRLKQDIISGLISVEILDTMLQDTTQDLREASKRWKISVEERLISLYSSTWEGMITCKVLQPKHFDGKFMNRFLSLLACLPVTGNVQALASSIILSTSTNQQVDMQLGIKSVVLGWSHSWLAQQKGGDIKASLRSTEAALSDAHRNLKALRELLFPVSTYIGQDCASPREVATKAHYLLSRAQSAATLAAEAINEAEETLYPLKASTRMLSITLDFLSPEVSSNIILSCLDSVSATRKKRRQKSCSSLYCWLSTVARMSNVGDTLFLQIWRNVDLHVSWSEPVYSDILLCHWISQGLVKRPWETYFSLATLNEQHFASLLFSLNKYRQFSTSRARDLISFLGAIDRHNMIPRLLRRMRSLHLKLPISTLAFSIQMTGKYNSLLAIDTYRLHFNLRPTHGCYRRLPWHFVHQFFTNLIRDPKVEPHVIWGLLGIPYQENRRIPRLRTRSISLRNDSINLINHVAMEFAQCGSRSTRVALRNTERALGHLQHKSTPILPEISMALVHVGITREIKAGQFIRQERLRYLLSVVEKVEGKNVADHVEDVVLKWRQYKYETSARQQRDAIIQYTREMREQNVLGVGPID
jgi:hypothetical protein